MVTPQTQLLNPMSLRTQFDAEHSLEKVHS